MGNRQSAKEAKVLWIGLGNIGKTTTLFRLKLGEVVTTLPTMGGSPEPLEYKNINFGIWDLNGNDRCRPLWNHYFENTDVIVYFVDSSDRGTIDLSAQEFQRVVNGIQNAIILVFAHKNDLQNIMDIEEIVDKLKLNELSNPWYIRSSSALTGDGLHEGVDWIVSVINGTEYEFDEETEDDKWVSNTNRPYFRNKKKSVLFVSGWTRNIDKKYELGISMDITQTICLFYTDLENEYKFKYYGQ